MSKRQTHLISGDIIALHEYQVIYFAIPKVANSSMKALCADLVRPRLDKEFLDKFWSDKWKPRIFRHPDARQYLMRTGILLSGAQVCHYKNYLRFCIVRSPWDRLVSCWKQKIGEADSLASERGQSLAASLASDNRFRAGMSFPEFAQVVAETPDEYANGHFRSQYTFITDETGALIADHVAKLENLDAEMNFICERTKIPKQSVPHLLRREGRPYHEYYTSATRDLVANRYRCDISTFGYSFEGSPKPST